MATGEMTVGVIAQEMGADVHNESPAGLIRLAVMNDLDMDKLERLIKLQRDRDDDMARQEFCEALSAFQGDVPPIGREDRVDAGRAGRRKYASLGTIFQAIREPLRKHSLSFRFRQQQEGERITVTCIVSHALGHSEETSLTAAADLSGGKNPIQSIGSTVTYLQRYTLVSALGLTTVDDDDDGEHTKQAEVSTEERARQQKAADVKAALFGGVAGPVNQEDPKSPADPGTVTDAQRTRIEQLFDALNASPEAREKILKNRGVNSVRSLSSDQADELIGKLDEKLPKEESRVPKTANAVLLTGPCSQGQIDLTKQLIGELEQMKPGTAAKVKAKLQAAGMSKLSDLSMADADNLLAQLGRRNIEEFFGASLMKAERPTGTATETNQGN